jgi:nicotinate-nucleotide adenylyltransferase
VRLAVSGNPRFDVDTMELDREGPSYSVDTLRTLGTRVAPALPVFLIGLDAFAEIDTWREPQTLFTLAHFAVLPRPPLREHSLEKWLPACLRSEVDLASDGRSGRHRSAGTWVRLMPITELDISATAVRARVRAGRSVRYLVPEGVREAVLASGVYQPKGN